jgi:hypothetical protein
MSLDFPSSPSGFSYEWNGTPEWRQYQEWLDEGNTPNPYVSPTPVDHLTNLQEAKEHTETLIKSTAYQHLQPTDWYVVRFTENATEIPEHITTFRATIRTESSSKIATVESKETLEHLKEYLRSTEYSTWTEI